MNEKMLIATRGGIDAVYPVGSIYMSMNATDPSELFGGSWLPLNEGRVLIGANSTYKAGTKGGEFTHKLTINEMPSHSHSGGMGTRTGMGGANEGMTRPFSTTTGSTGGNQPHNNMQPYLAVYMWYRNE